MNLMYCIFLYLQKHPKDERRKNMSKSSKKEKTISIRLTEEEYNQLHSNAKKNNISVGRYIATMACNEVEHEYYNKQKQVKVCCELSTELERVGKKYPKENFAYLAMKVNKLWQL